MSDYTESDSASMGHDADAASFPDELPPVQPPSAGFILQLFVVPGLIVLAIVGVWALFGRLAAGEQDWRRLLVDLQSNNQHVRERGMHGLAHLLNSDQRLGADGQSLAESSEIAQPLAALLDSALRKGTQDDETVNQQVFLTRTLGVLDSPDIALPPLQEALRPGYDREVRKSAAASIAFIAGRALERGRPLQTSSVVDGLVELSSDADPVLRGVAAFTLGLFSSGAAEQRLLVLLDDRDAMTRVNAGIGLARHDSVAPYGVFRSVLVDSQNSAAAEPLSEETRFENSRTLENVLRAVGELAERFSPDQRQELSALIEPIAAGAQDGRIRIEAQRALTALTKAPRA